MFGFLKQTLVGNSHVGPESRNIFRYFDGQQETGADPLLIFRKFSAHKEFDLQRHCSDLVSGVPELENEASRIAVDALREIFGIQPWHEETNPAGEKIQVGLTEAETLGILNDFMLFADSLKKNVSGQQT